MDVRLNAIHPIPRETSRSAKGLFSGDNFYMRVGEQLESIVAVMPVENHPATGEFEALLPLVTFFQAMEGLVDSQAVNAIRLRIDWKYALHMPIHTPTLHERSLCDFRCEIMPEPVRRHDFQKLIDRLLLLKPQFNTRLQEIRSEEVLSLVCSINHNAALHEAIHQAVEVLAVQYPEWLQKIALPHWYGRYTGISIPPTGDDACFIEEGIADIRYLLERIQRSGSAEMLELEEIKTLDQVKSRHLQKQSQILHEENGGLEFENCDFCACKAATTRH